MDMILTLKGCAKSIRSPFVPLESAPFIDFGIEAFVAGSLCGLPHHLSTGHPAASASVQLGACLLFWEDLQLRVIEPLHVDRSVVRAPLTCNLDKWRGHNAAALRSSSSLCFAPA